MLEFLQVILPICIYILLIILLIVGIILGVRLINTMDRVDAVINDVNKKVKSLNSFFNVIDFTTDKISLFSDRLVDLISGAISKITTFRKKRKKDEEETYE